MSIESSASYNRQAEDRHGHGPIDGAEPEIARPGVVYDQPWPCVNRSTEDAFLGVPPTHACFEEAIARSA
eukprot:2831291-Rhodomonas_salina.2